MLAPFDADVISVSLSGAAYRDKNFQKTFVRSPDDPPHVFPSRPNPFRRLQKMAHLEFTWNVTVTDMINQCDEKKSAFSVFEQPD